MTHTELMAMLLAAGAMPGAWADGAHGKVRLWEDGPFWAAFLMSVYFTM